MRINLGCGSDRRQGYVNVDTFAPGSDVRSDLIDLGLQSGTVVLMVPDFSWVLQNGMSLPESQKWGWAIDAIFDNQDHEGEYHRIGFTQTRMRRLLEEAGFGGIKVDTVFSHGMSSIRDVASTVESRYRLSLLRRATNKIVMAKYRLRGALKSRLSGAA